jgi:tetratricopeptide (TPR) repeat protein
MGIDQGMSEKIRIACQSLGFVFGCRKRKLSSGLKWRLVLTLLAVSVNAGAEECATVLQRAIAAFNSKALPVAAREFEQALRVCEDRGPVLRSLAQVQYLLGEEIQAEQHLLRAIGINPKDSIYYQQSRYPEAVEQLSKVTEIDPANHKAWDNLGLCYDALQQDADALRAFFRALDLVKDRHPGYDWAYANLADFFLRRNEHEKAFQLAAEAAQRNPASARNFFLTGKALSKLGKEDLSLRWLEQAVKLDPEYTEALYLLAQTYRKLGRAEEANKTLSQFREAGKNPRPRR